MKLDLRAEDQLAIDRKGLERYVSVRKEASKRVLPEGTEIPDIE